MVLCDWDSAPFWVVSSSLTQMLFEKKLSSISLAMIQRRGGQKNDEQLDDTFILRVKKSVAYKIGLPLAAANW
ncbi:hypothetical protein Pyn_26497 [Prunus yedoensis var. nudiflora]|uniref:Uncharacterized protein n=1 Tax=Prunus yedoensis var. nudiflora TaxID=2094558 RepID=A0A314YVZ2_PRUYE|nr:hypothetical protein Pyn_26497 [Prunus yedoensis var. nudiflora]